MGLNADAGLGHPADPCGEALHRRRGAAGPAGARVRRRSRPPRAHKARITASQTPPTSAAARSRGRARSRRRHPPGCSARSGCAAERAPPSTPPEDAPRGARGWDEPARARPSATARRMQRPADRDRRRVRLALQPRLRPRAQQPRPDDPERDTQDEHRDEGDHPGRDQQPPPHPLTLFKRSYLAIPSSAPAGRQLALTQPTCVSSVFVEPHEFLVAGRLRHDLVARDGPGVSHEECEQVAKLLREELELAVVLLRPPGGGVDADAAGPRAPRRRPVLLPRSSAARARSAATARMVREVSVWRRRRVPDLVELELRAVRMRDREARVPGALLHTFTPLMSGRPMSSTTRSPRRPARAPRVRYRVGDRFARERAQPALLSIASVHP